MFRSYRCTKSGIKQISCPSGLAFDIDKQTCDWKSKVTNCDRLDSKFRQSFLGNGFTPNKKYNCTDWFEQFEDYHIFFQNEKKKLINVKN